MFRPSRSSRPPGLPRSVAWPLPAPGRRRHAWLLGLGLRRWLLRRQLRRALPYLGSTRTIVDLGAGTGAGADELLGLLPDDPGRRMLLLEAQRPMIEDPAESRSRPRAGYRGRVVADAARVPVRDGSSDVVLSLGLLCCVAPERVTDVVRETARILAPGGVLVLAVPRRRGRADDRATLAAGLRRVAGGRPGHSVFAKPL